MIIEALKLIKTLTMENKKQETLFILGDKLKRKPFSPQLLEIRGGILCSMSLHKLAIKDFNLLIKLKEGTEITSQIFFRMKVNWTLGRIEEAKEDANKVLAQLKDDRNPLSALSRSKALSYLKRQDEALKETELVEAHVDDFIVAIEKCRIFQLKGDFERALEESIKVESSKHLVISSQTWLSAAKCEKARCFAALGKIEECISYTEDAYRIESDHSYVCWFRGIVFYLFTERKEEARRICLENKVHGKHRMKILLYYGELIKGNPWFEKEIRAAVEILPEYSKLFSYRHPLEYLLPNKGFDVSKGEEGEIK